MGDQIDAVCRSSDNQSGDTHSPDIVHIEHPSRHGADSSDQEELLEAGMDLRAQDDIATLLSSTDVRDVLGPDIHFPKKVWANSMVTSVSFLKFWVTINATIYIYISLISI